MNGEGGREGEYVVRRELFGPRRSALCSISTPQFQIPTVQGEEKDGEAPAGPATVHGGRLFGAVDDEENDEKLGVYGGVG